MSALKRNFSVILFYGAAWGIVEATLGHVLHILSVFSSLPLAGVVMIPIGVYFMMKAFRQSNSVYAIFCTGAIAASIKLLDFFAPGIPPQHVLHPTLAILLEAVAVNIFAGGFAKSKVFVSLGDRIGLATPNRFAANPLIASLVFVAAGAIELISKI